MTSVQKGELVVQVHNLWIISLYIILGIEMEGDKKNCGLHVKKHQGSLLCVRAYNAMFYKRVPVCTRPPTLENLCSSCIFGRNTVCQI